MKNLLLLFLLFFLVSIPTNAQLVDCEECGERLLADTDAEGLSLEALSLLRNEIYARKGYVFSKSELDRYFSSKKWYKPVGANATIVLSQKENHNVDFFKRKEVEEQDVRDAMILHLKELKVALNNSDQGVVNKFMSKLFKEEPGYEVSLLSNLKKILNHVDLDALHWYNGKGLYVVVIDNGFCKSRYGIYVVNNILRVEGSDQMSYSEIFEDSDDVYSYYESIGEHSEAFVFKMTKNGIVYDYFWAAG